jgi:hypothetical protein
MLVARRVILDYTTRYLRSGYSLMDLWAVGAEWSQGAINSASGAVIGGGRVRITAEAVAVLLEPRFVVGRGG